MSRLRRLSRGGRFLVVLAVGGAVFGIASAVQASIPDANGVIHGCYNNSLAHGSPTGALRVIDTAKPNGNCASWEAPLNWNQRGVTGPTGPKGATGPTGPQGPGATAGSTTVPQDNAEHSLVTTDGVTLLARCSAGTPYVGLKSANGHTWFFWGTANVGLNLTVPLDGSLSPGFLVDGASGQVDLDGAAQDETATGTAVHVDIDNSLGNPCTARWMITPTS